MSDSFDPYHKWLGIPPADQPPTHYRLLGIAEFESDPDVIDAAAEQRMIFLQNLSHGPRMEESQKLLNEVSAARLCLLNAEKKEAYDAKLKQPKPPPIVGVPVAPAEKPLQLKSPPELPTAMPVINTGEDTGSETDSRDAGEFVFTDPPKLPATAVKAPEQKAKNKTTPDDTVAKTAEDGQSAEEEEGEPKAPWPRWVWIAAGSGTATVISLTVFFVVLALRADPRKELAEKGKAQLTIIWPVGQRKGGELLVNGEPRELPDSEGIDLVLDPGEYYVVAQRDGFRDIEQTVKLKKGQIRKFKLSWRKLGE